MAWITQTEVEGFAQCSYPAADPRVAAYIAAAEGFIESVTGPMLHASVTDIHVYDGRPRLWLRVRPVVTIDSFLIDGTAISDLGLVTVHHNAAVGTASAGGFIVIPRGAHVTVGYTAGHYVNAAAVPDSVKLIAARIVADLVTVNGTARPVGVASEKLDEWAITYDTETGAAAMRLSPDERAMLARYSTPAVV